MIRETWVILRGLSREAGHWGPFLPALARAMPDADVLALDLPGAGARLGDRWPATVGEAMEMIRAEARGRAGERATLRLFGLSLGGMVVMEWAARHPEEVGGLVVGASSAADAAPFYKRMRPRGWAMMLAGALTRDPERRQMLSVRTVCNRRDLWAQTARAWTEIERLRPVAAATVGAQVFAASRWAAPRALRVPTLFLVGAHDRLVHPDCSRRLASRYGATLVEHPEAGHDLTTDATDWVVEELMRFRHGLARKG